MRIYLCGIAALTLCGIASAAPWTVDDDLVDFPGADFQDIQSAVDAASSGDQIQVYPGTYLGTGDQVVDLSGKDLHLIGIGQNHQIILDGENARRGVVFTGNSSNSSQIENLTVTNGQAPSNNPRGGGVFVQLDRLAIYDCRLIACQSPHYGGAASCMQGHMTLEGCTISDNVSMDTLPPMGGGGGVHVASGLLIVNDCTFSRNMSQDSGSAVYSVSSDLTITNSAFSHNSATVWGAVRCTLGSSTIDQCTFVGNYAGSGAGYSCMGPGHSVANSTFEFNLANNYGGGIATSHSTELAITDCVIENNTAGFIAGGVYLHTTQHTIDNCTIRDNRAADSGGGIYTESSVPLGNTLVCGNLPDQIVGPSTLDSSSSMADDCDASCEGDFDENGQVDINDLLTFLNNYGPCP